MHLRQEKKLKMKDFENGSESQDAGTAKKSLTNPDNEENDGNNSSNEVNFFH